MNSIAERAGRFIGGMDGIGPFIPASLPPDPPVAVDPAMLSQLSAADLALGRLDGVIQEVPNPDLFVAMYVRREAVLSSQIEGTQSTLEDLLAVELEPQTAGLPNDIEEVVNYVQAMNHGLERVASLPLSKRLIREIHEVLLSSGRGAARTPGDFRRDQNWIGPDGATIAEATFVPPPVPEMHASLDDFERFLHDESLPPLLHAGIAHAQFETIHPFIDGNGRVGRLLITFLLVHRRALQRPLLYLSVYLKRNRAEYYDRLTAIRQSGDWEGWLRFFLRGVEETAREATTTARGIREMRELHRHQATDLAGVNGGKLIDLLFVRPLLNVKLVCAELDVAFATANALVAQFESAGLVDEITGGRRNRVFRYGPYLDLLDDGRPTPAR